LVIIPLAALTWTAHSTGQGQAVRTHHQPGEAQVTLPDGRVLTTGGVDVGSRVSVRDPRTGRDVVLTATGLEPRAWHTATLLPDGSILVAGGVDGTGTPIGTLERLDLSSGTAQRLPSTIAPRAHHTATVLPDGQVLFAGGDGDTLLDAATVWNSATGQELPAKTLIVTPRRGHRASVEPDGTVRITGGTGIDGRLVDQDEVFDPASQGFRLVPTSTPYTRVEALMTSLPANGATDVSLASLLVLHFGVDLDLTFVRANSVQLAGPDGPIDAAVVPTERGRLVFLRPRVSLAYSTAYTVTAGGLRAAGGQVIPAASVTFVTEAAPMDPEPPVDDEVWMPDLSDSHPGKWTTNRPDSPWQKLPPLQAPQGQSALAGQVLRLNGHPLGGVTLELNGRSTRTDKTGRFLLDVQGLATGRHELEIEGETASRPGRRYGFFEYGLDLTAGRTNVLPFTIWMPVIDTKHAVRIASPTTSEVVVTTPSIPGLELRLPRGTTIRDHEGQIVREVSLTPIPVDRPPFPLPKNVDVPIYFTAQPGNAYVYSSYGKPGRARLIYPNYHGERPRVIASFWNYDPELLGWHVYGSGKVTDAADRVVPNTGVGIYEFSGAMMSTGWSPAPTAAAVGNPFSGGDPVDLGTGLFIYEKTDLMLPDVLPLSLTRTYRPDDLANRPFGFGTTHPYAMFLWSEHQYTEADLILPDSRRVHYVRTSPGTSFYDAVFEHTSSPTIFYKSRIAWNGSGWDLTLKNGTVLVFADNAPLQAIRDRYGNTIRVTWSNGVTGLVTRVTSPHLRWIEFTYDDGNRISQAKDNIGRTVSYTYDASNRLWKVTDAANGVTEYTYDSSHRMKTIKDARGIVFLTNDYDANGRVIKQTQADGTTFEFAWTLDGAGLVTQVDVTNPRTFVTRYLVNPEKYITSITEALGTSLARTTSLVRQAGSNFISNATDPLTRQTLLSYDPSGNLATVTRLANTSEAVTTSFTYTPTFNQLATVTDPLQHTWTFGYDPRGNLTSITDPLTHQVTASFNGAGQVLTVTDALSHTTQLEYTSGDLTAVTDPLGNRWTHFVDGAGRVARQTDPLGRWTQREFDALNRLTKTVDPIGGETIVTWDANGNALSLRDPKLSLTSWTYDPMDRAGTRTDPMVRSESYLYDGNGNLRQVTDRKSQITTRTYDALDRPAVTTFQDGSSTTYTFDAGDRLTQVIDTLSGTITRGYDGLDRLTSESTPDGNVTYTYDAADRRSTFTVSGQPTTTYGYDNANRLSSITQGSAVASFTYDNANRRTSLSFPNGLATEYEYDDASRLTGLTFRKGGSPVGTLTYGYDGAGNRTALDGTWARTGLPSAAIGTYDAGHRIATWNGVPHNYDANGNLTSDGSRIFSWSSREQLVAIAGSVSGGSGYDGLGRRRVKTAAGVTTSFVYDGLNAVQERAGGSPTANILNGAGLDEWLQRVDAGGAHNFLTDDLGSTVALTDGSGAPTTHYTYEPFGRPSVSGTPSGNPSQSTGREADDAGLYFQRARFYDSSRHRFISEDPIGFLSGDTNLYAYVGNNPTRFRDPLGLDGVGLVISGGLSGFGFYVNVSVAPTVTNGFDAGTSFGWSAGGSSGFGGNVSVGGHYSPDAMTLSDYAGTNVNAGVGGSVAGAVMGYEWSGGRNAAGRLISNHVFSAGAGSKGIPGWPQFETHAGAGQSWALGMRDSWMNSWNWLRDAWNWAQGRATQELICRVFAACAPMSGRK
jgi:RHS repeat-associated protein